MSKLYEAMKAELDRLMCAHRVMLHRGPTAICGREPTAITSAVPEVRIDNGRDRFKNRRQRIRLQRGPAHVTLLIHHRPIPEELDPRGSLVQWGTNRDERRIPLSCVDRRTGTAHVLVDLSAATVADASAASPSQMVVDALLADPLEELLTTAGKPRVGSGVAGSIRSLIADGKEVRRSALEREVALLERSTRPGGLHRTLLCHLENLKNLLRALPAAGHGRMGNDEAVDREISRLERLVASRACAALRFGPDEISGLLNPRMLERCQLHPLMFRLCMGRGGRRGGLSFWYPQRPNPSASNRVCLGEAAVVLRSLDQSGDLYGMVDTVLNFVETNRVGVFRCGRRPPWERCDIHSVIDRPR
jgi:hypothetical protein